MRTKTYVFEDVKKAMEVLKEDYGPDALILDVKTVGTNGSSRCEISVLVGEKSEDITSFPRTLRERTEGLWVYFLDFLNGKTLEIEKSLILKHIEEYPLPLRIMFERMRKNGISLDLACKILSRVFIAAADVLDSMSRAFYFVRLEILKELLTYEIQMDSRPIILFGPKYSGKSVISRKLYFRFKELGLKPIVVVHGKGGRLEEILNLKVEREERINSTFAESDDDLLVRLSEIKEKKVIIDYGGETPGKLLEALPKEAERLLVLPAGLRDERIAKYLSENEGRINGVIFTKLDEELTLGHILESCIRFRTPISLISFGTNIRDIVSPKEDLFYRLLLEGVRWLREGEK